MLLYLVKNTAAANRRPRRGSCGQHPARHNELSPK